MSRRLLVLIACAAGSICPSKPVMGNETSEVERLLDLPFEKLINVHVTSPSQTSHPVRNAANSVTLITAAQIRAMGARTLSDVLKMLPATQILNRRNGLDSVMIRGIPSGRNTKVLLLIDGVPREEVIFGEWSPDEQIQLTNIDRIEIIRGPGSALYGSNAYAGIISIFTKSIMPTKTQVDLTAGKFDTSKIEYSTGVAVGEGMLLSSGSFYKTDGYRMQADRLGEPTDHNNAVHTNNVHLKFIKENWQASFNVNEYSTEYPLYPAEENKSQDYTFIDSNVKHIKKWKNSGLESQLYMYDVHRYFDHEIENQNGNLEFRSNSKLNTTLLGIKNQFSYEFSQYDKFVAGLSLEHQRVDHYDETAFVDGGLPDIYSISVINKNGDTTPNSNNVAVYAQQESSFLDDALTLTGGIRLDHFDNLDSRASPRLGLTYRSNEKWSTKLLWGRAFRKPTLLEQYEVRSDNNSPGNPNLTPEDIETTEAEYTYLFNEKSYASVTFFRSKMLHFIQTIDLQPYQNNPEALVVPGASLEWSSQFAHRWWQPGQIGVSANYTYLDTDLSSVARDSGNLMLFSENEKIGLFVGVNYLGRRNISDTYHSLVVNNQQKLRDNNHGYAVLDTGIRWKQFSVENFQLGITIHNLFNRTYYNPEIEPDNYYDMTKAPREIDLTGTYRF